MNFSRDFQLVSKAFPSYKLFPEIGVFLGKPIRFQPPFNLHEQVGRIPGLDDIAIYFTAVNRFHQDIDVCISGQDNSNRLGPDIQSSFQKINACYIGHPLVCDDHGCLRIFHQKVQRLTAGICG